MNDRRLPTRIVPTGRRADGSAGQGVGWLQSLANRLRGLQAQFEGLNMRLNTPLADGVPSAVSGELLFKATDERVTLTDFPISEQGVSTVATIVVNPIIRAGQTYRVSLTLPPPGVFMAHNLFVTVEAGTVLFGGQQRPYITDLNDTRQDRLEGAGFVAGPQLGNLNFSQQQQVLHGTPRFFSPSPWGQNTYLPYFWNIIDEKSGRQYSQDWLPHGLLMNTRRSTESSEYTADGEFFEFDTPWLFERDAQVSFLFRPIMDLYQIAATEAALLPYPNTDDRAQGRRVQQATVRVEMHGNRYYTRQDVLKEGAVL
jgi:hypothetical protein